MVNICWVFILFHWAGLTWCGSQLTKFATDDMLQDQESPKNFEAASDSSQFGDTENQSADSGSFPMDVLETIKNKVVDMVNNVTGFLQNIFGFAAADKTSSEAADAGGFTIDKTLGAAFTGLAMMVIVVVLLKRA